MTTAQGLERTAPARPKAELEGKFERAGTDRVRVLVRDFLRRRSPHTLDAYQRDLESFASFLGSSPVAALEQLFRGGAGEANRIAMAWRSSLEADGLAPATINRRLAALRSVAELAYRTELVPWQLRVDGVKSRAYRDTRGPGVAGFRALLAELEQRGDDAKARRDRAALRLLYDMALRRSEVVRLDIDDLDLERCTVWVTAKGRAESEPLKMPSPTVAAVSRWLEVRGREPGAVFVSLDRRSSRGRLRRLWPSSLSRIVRDLGAAANVRATPHGLRHTAITEALTATGGNVREVQSYSRHADPQTVMIYDDNRRDRGGAIAELVATRAGA